ncbi:hypothetical protein [Mycoplasma seminis]|uniref:Lipoprotein n=1 Tax=Mycoplasma seminis TaxID=512749 RepID=A0ABY9HA79_9MOLU|nr:hypothetical protein [Mycoplasma seminis]WLP85509.1 hypothetical protein Q8852_04295 [Mycoplasma seminis]
MKKNKLILTSGVITSFISIAPCISCSKIEKETKPINILPQPAEATEIEKINNKLLTITGLNSKLDNNISTLFDIKGLNDVIDFVKKYTYTSYVNNLKKLISDINIKNIKFDSLSKEDKIKYWAQINIINNYINYFINKEILHSYQPIAVPAEANYPIIDFETKTRSIKETINPINIDQLDKFLPTNNKSEINIKQNTINYINKHKPDLKTIWNQQAYNILKNHKEIELNLLKCLDLETLNNNQKFVNKDFWDVENNWYIQNINNNVIDKPSWYPKYQIKNNKLLTDLIWNNNLVFAPLAYWSNSQSSNVADSISIQELKLDSNNLSEIYNSDVLSFQAKKSLRDIFEKSIANNNILLHEDYDAITKYINSNPDIKVKFYKISTPLNVSDNTDISFNFFPGINNQLFITYLPQKYKYLMGDYTNNDLIDYSEYKAHYSNIFALQAERFLNKKIFNASDYLKAMQKYINQVFQPDKQLQINPQEPIETKEYIIPIIDDDKQLEIHFNSLHSIDELSSFASQMELSSFILNFKSNAENKLDNSNYLSLEKIGPNLIEYYNFLDPDILKAYGISKDKVNDYSDISIDLQSIYPKN